MRFVNCDRGNGTLGARVVGGPIKVTETCPKLAIEAQHLPPFAISPELANNGKKQVT